ncbi:activator 1 subunit [Aphelenchoides avenae]|nr:activator 1 subunit [Aphelenchus avenae]
MSLWVDKYRPRELPELTYHKPQAEQVSKLLETGDFPHLLLCGPNGAGKRTRIQCILKELYGPGAENVQIIQQTFQTASGRKVSLTVLSSNYHIELTPSDVGIYDRVVVQDVIKEMAGVQQIDITLQRPFKVVVLMEADNLTKDAQHGLRRTMEKYASTCKIILCCESMSKVIDPLKSRCMVIRVAAPSDVEVREGIKAVCKKEKVTATDVFLDRLVIKSEGNMRRALLLLEATASQHGDELDAQPVMEPEWETYVRDTAKLMLQRQTSDTLLEVRQRFYELHSRCIPISEIFVRIIDALLPHCDPSLASSIVSAAAKYEHTCRLGSKPVFHFEAFVATFMTIIMNYKATAAKGAKR